MKKSFVLILTAFLTLVAIIALRNIPVVVLHNKQRLVGGEASSSALPVTSTQIASLTPLGDGTQLYSNQSGTYQIVIPASWSFDSSRSSDEETVFDRRAGPEDHTSIAFQSSSKSITALRAEYDANSSYDYDIATMTIDGEPAFSFSTYGVEGGGIIVIHKGEFVLFSPGTDVWPSSILATFKFTN